MLIYVVMFYIYRLYVLIFCRFDSRKGLSISNILKSVFAYDRIKRMKGLKER